MQMRSSRAVLLSVAAGVVALVPAAAPAQAAKSGAKAAKPKIIRVTPMRIAVGETLTIRGKGFSSKPRSNTVIFQGTGGRTAFAKPRRASRTKLVVKVPGSVGRLLAVKDGKTSPTRLKLRVLAAKKFSAFTPRRLSPVVLGLGSGGGNQNGGGGGNGGDGGGVPVPPPVCNSDADHDDDLLSNALELQIGTNPCRLDSDGDGVEDGYEYRSAKDLNDDELQDPGTVLPYPGKRPYPNPLDPGDDVKDYDGDSLTLSEEQRLWRYTIALGRSTRTLFPLSYSDGEQFSSYILDSDNRRLPSLVADGYSLHQSFVIWATDNGYRTIGLVDHQAHWTDPNDTRAPYGLFDMNRDGSESASILPGYARNETRYYDLIQDGVLSDDERDEDADGLTNFDETHGRLTSEYWQACYTIEKPFDIVYADPDVTDPDSDGDGVRDGADDQDHDDIPNVMELSRLAGSGLWDAERECKPLDTLPSPPATNHPDAYGRVNPFNPCLPMVQSRTCTLHPGLGGDSAPYDDSLDWASLN
jgi:hypothetical protein